MKFTIATLAASITAAAAIPANSQVGQHLLSQARRLDQNNQYDFEEEFAWLTGYSVKFQGCHNIKQWNGDADGDEDVKIETKKLVRFRLCPADSCSASKAAGCNSAYGDYVIDMDTYMNSYIQGKQQWDEYNCQVYLADSCSCVDDGNQGDDWNEEYCQYDCFNEAGMTECIDRNPYQEEEEEQFNLEEYMECKEIKAQNNNNRRLDQQEVQYFVGPYCAGQGGAIKLGLFTDDTCTIAAEDVSFTDLMGFSLPYSGEDENMVDAKCLACIEKEYQEDDGNNNNNNNDQEDADQINEMCEMIYSGAGKCEAAMPEGMVYTPNNNACNYMEGIRIVRQDGIIDTGSSRPSAVATSFIVIFAMAFAAMAFYVWYLRTRLGVKKNTLL